ncbi:MAG TPA: hypothetical protein P5521_00945 [Candidatus Omnitrophota bacterium]|nr:hypothetical protein [Candidatus Omnitrophota bacterium]
MRLKTGRIVRIIVISLLLAACRQAGASGGKVKAYYFYSRDCAECIEMMESYIPGLQEKYGPDLEIKCLEVNEPGNLELLFGLEEGSHRLNNPLPSLFIGDRVLDGESHIRRELSGLIEYYISTGGCDWPAAPGLNTADGHGQAIGRFKGLGVPAIVGAGLIDGINPCAFAAITFLISYLIALGRKGRDILIIGGIFTFAVFMTYLLVGLGAFELVKRVDAYPLIGRAVSSLIAALAAFMGVLSLYDYRRIRQGRAGDVILQLPRDFKDRIHSAVRERSRSRRLIPASFILGFLIALLEFPCTGQSYLPVVFALRNVPEMKARAVTYLLLYNLMFIIPLITVFILAYKGTSSGVLIGLMQKHAGKVKILTAALFFALAFVLAIYGD